MSVALAAAVYGAACAGAGAGTRADTSTGAAESLAPLGSGPPGACGSTANEVAALAATGPAADVVAALQAGDAPRARAEAEVMLARAEAEAVAAFHEGATDAATMRAYLDRWVYAETPALAVAVDRFVMHPRLAAAIDHAECLAERL